MLAPRAGVTLSSCQDKVAISGPTNPTSGRFSPDGRISVAQKIGPLLAYASLTDASPVVFADLRMNVDDHWDRAGGTLWWVRQPNQHRVPVDPR